MMPFTQILSLFSVGLLAGLASGLFGIGGGLVMIPMFLYVLKMETHRAMATSLAVLMFPVVLPGVIVLYRAGNIDFRFVVCVAVGFAFASMIGARLNLIADTQTLNRLFALLLVYTAVHLWTKPVKRPPAVPPPPIAEEVR